MKQTLRITLTLLLLAVAANAQSATPVKLSDFAGTYAADFHKKTWLVLTLNPAGDSLTGTLKHAVEISSDDEGDITKVGDEMSSDTVEEVKLEGRELEITTKDDEGDRDHYVMVLTGPSSAELRSDAGNGARSPKPFKLKRNVAQDPNSKAAPQGGPAHQK